MFVAASAPLLVCMITDIHVHRILYPSQDAEVPFTVKKTCPQDQAINTQFNFIVVVTAPSALPKGIKVQDLLPSSAVVFDKWGDIKYSIAPSGGTGGKYTCVPYMPCTRRAW